VRRKHNWKIRDLMLHPELTEGKLCVFDIESLSSSSSPLLPTVEARRWVRRGMASLLSQVEPMSAADAFEVFELLNAVAVAGDMMGEWWRRRLRRTVYLSYGLTSR
jgi:hypothetical protein